MIVTIQDGNAKNDINTILPLSRPQYDALRKGKAQPAK